MDSGYSKKSEAQCVERNSRGAHFKVSTFLGKERVLQIVSEMKQKTND